MGRIYATVWQFIILINLYRLQETKFILFLIIFRACIREAVSPILINFKLAAGPPKRIVRSINFRHFANT
jgi:hypothetical protein